MKRFLIAWAIWACLATAPLTAAAAGGAPAPEAAEASRPGAFCTSTRCRPRPASALEPAAFGAAVLAIGWRARRRQAGRV